MFVQVELQYKYISKLHVFLIAGCTVELDHLDHIKCIFITLIQSLGCWLACLIKQNKDSGTQQRLIQ